MGVFRGRGAVIDTVAIKNEMAPAVALWQSAYIVILNPGPNGIYLRDKNNAAFVWHGKARVQPYRREVPTATVSNPTTNQSVRFQLDFTKWGSIPDIKTGYQVAVLPEAVSGVPLNDPYMSQYQHAIASTLNSSLAWIRTLETTVNTELRPNYMIESNGAGGFRWIAAAAAIDPATLTLTGQTPGLS